MSGRPQVGVLLAHASDEERERIYAGMDGPTRKAVDRDFDEWALLGQHPPRGDWRVWLILAGRGYGKTRAGAEWVTKLARRSGRRHIAIVGATMDEARSVMIEGPSGLLACADPRRMLKWEPSLNRLTYKTGVVAQLFSAENPDGLRGPEHQYAWCDELAKWTYPDATWSNLMFGLRQGKDQRVLVTTTPRPIPLLKTLIDDPATVRTGGGSADNLYLPKSFLNAVRTRYAGTHLGRQELDGELIEDVEGALWTRGLLEKCREPLPFRLREGSGGGRACLSAEEAISGPPAPAASGSGELVRIVIGVDPPASSSGDACGIVICGLDANGIGYLLEDASVTQPRPERWAMAVAAAAARWGADRIIAEANQGGEMVASVLRAQGDALPLTLVHASRGKVARAEPVRMLYERGRVRHAGIFPELEDQLCGFTIGGGYEGPGRSPDRADALVWALTELMLGRRAAPRVTLL
ncbi:MAG TPA: terminase family protein [Sphingomonas sp.]|nr:terminase family protein [Sphingomonas sp.]